MIADRMPPILPDPELLALARATAARAYAPYSHFTVGAVLVGADGHADAGCNVENASYGLTLCAERNALVQAVSRGCRAFSALYLVAPKPVLPCGACLQVLAEFCEATLPIHIAALDAATSAKTVYLGDLLTAPFTLATT